MMLSVNCCESWDHVIGNTPYRNIYLYIYPIGKYIYIPYRNIYIYPTGIYIYLYPTFENMVFVRIKTLVLQIKIFN